MLCHCRTLRTLLKFGFVINIAFFIPLYLRSINVKHPVIKMQSKSEDIIDNNCIKIPNNNSKERQSIDFIVAPRNINGSLILFKNVTKYWNQPLRKWNATEELLISIHIGKAGGTAFDTAIGRSTPSVGSSNRHCKMECVTGVRHLPHKIEGCPNVRPIICGRHFDWSYVETVNISGYHPAPIVLFREPVARMVSQFYFAQRLPWTKGLKIREQNLSEYLSDVESMMQTYEVWYDGEAAASWLAGTHIAHWVAPGLKPTEMDRRESLGFNWTYMLDIALDNIHKCLWIGILEEADKSMELLKFQTGLEFKFGHSNRRSYPKPSHEEIEKIKRLMPMDLYLYEYVKQLFEHRWRLYTNGALKKHSKFKLPSIIHGCRSTSKHLSCPNSDSLS